MFALGVIVFVGTTVLLYALQVRSQNPEPNHKEEAE